jgi:hypothetical protein
VLIMWRCYCELHTDEYLQVVDQNVAFKGKQDLDCATMEILSTSATKEALTLDN